MPPKEPKKTVAMVLEENDIEIVQEFAALHGISFSSAIRMIIREWARKLAPQYETPAPTSEQA